jgi:aspartyl aminopeptidase
VRTVDVGLPQLSMHSIREMAAVDDLVHGLALIRAFYRHFARFDAQLVVDRNL